MTGKAPPYVVRCEWCSVERRTCRRDTRTCSSVCRQRLGRYCRALGYSPATAPGNVTAFAAIDAEVLRLVELEAKRRNSTKLPKKALLRRSPRKSTA